LFRLKHSYAEKQCCAKTSHMSLGWQLQDKKIIFEIF
jgi:hypothetical protein